MPQLKEFKFIIDEDDKTRIKCPKCYSFICEIKPILLKGQEIVTRCRKCATNVMIKR
jgi:hypothetical protein